MALGVKPKIWNINVGILCRDLGVMDEKSSVWNLATNRAVVIPRLKFFFRCYNDLVGGTKSERGLQLSIKAIY